MYYETFTPNSQAYRNGFYFGASYTSASEQILSTRRNANTNFTDAESVLTQNATSASVDYDSRGMTSEYESYQSVTANRNINWSDGIGNQLIAGQALASRSNDAEWSYFDTITKFTWYGSTLDTASGITTFKSLTFQGTSSGYVNTQTTSSRSFSSSNSFSVDNSGTYNVNSSDVAVQVESRGLFVSTVDTTAMLTVVTGGTTTVEVQSLSADSEGVVSTFNQTITQSSYFTTEVSANVTRQGNYTLYTTTAYYMSVGDVIVTSTSAGFTNDHGFTTVHYLALNAAAHERLWLLSHNENAIVAVEGLWSTSGRFYDLHSYVSGDGPHSIASKYALASKQIELPTYELSMSRATNGQFKSSRDGVDVTVESNFTYILTLDKGNVDSLVDDYGDTLFSYESSYFSYDTNGNPYSTTRSEVLYGFTTSYEEILPHYYKSVQSTHSYDSMETVVFDSFIPVYNSNSRFLGFSSVESTVIASVNKTTTIQVFPQPIQVNKYTYNYSSLFGGATMAYTNEAGGSVALSSVEVERIAPKYYYTNNVGAAGIQIYYKSPRAGYAGFLGTTEGNYDSLQIGSTVSLGIAEGSPLAGNIGVNIADIQSFVLMQKETLWYGGSSTVDISNNVTVFALETHRDYTFSLYDSVASSYRTEIGTMRALNPSDPMSTVSSIAVTMSSSIEKKHRLYQTSTYSGATVEELTYLVSLAGIDSRILYQSVRVATTYSDSVARNIVATAAGVLKADAPATVFAGYGFVSWSLYGVGDSLPTGSGSTFNENNFCSFTIDAASGVRISAEPVYSVGYTNIPLAEERLYLYAYTQGE